MPKVKDVHRLGVIVKDLEKAVDFFVNNFGAKKGIVYRKDETENFPIVYDEIEPEGLKSCYVTLGQDFQIELMSPSKPDGNIAKLLEKRGEGILTVCFQVDSVDEAIKELESKGVRIVGKEQLNWITKIKMADGSIKEVPTPYVFVHPKDAFGLMIEIGLR
ncbi:MAG: VOC family protein [Candidatus Schekmanbacteria bacterium]|nr:VOC family protein [Candidatus Schekmanbacteria bacterium]